MFSKKKTRQTNKNLVTFRILFFTFLSTGIGSSWRHSHLPYCLSWPLIRCRNLEAKGTRTGFPWRSCVSTQNSSVLLLLILLQILSRMSFFFMSLSSSFVNRLIKDSSLHSPAEKYFRSFNCDWLRVMRAETHGSLVSVRSKTFFIEFCGCCCLLGCSVLWTGMLLRDNSLLCLQK